MLEITNSVFTPYLNLSLNLIEVKRKGAGTMFRHQLETFAILIEMGYSDSVLLKASLIHDLIEDFPEVKLHDIIKIDNEGEAVVNLVKEVSIKVVDNKEELKKDFLLRIMKEGSKYAKVLKLADRISNVSSLSNVDNKTFVKKYINETIQYILPFAKGIDPKMANELNKIISIIIKHFNLNNNA